MTTMNKTVILEKQTRQSILMGLLEQQPSITNTSFVSLQVFLSTLVRDERQEDWFRCAKLLQDHAQAGGILETTLRYPISIDHMMSFIQTMIDEGWTLDDLPLLNPKERALKDILSILWPHFQRRAQQWEQFMDKTEPSSIQVYDHFYPFAIHQRLMNLEKKGLTYTRLPKKNPKIQVKFAKNPRSEAQACVQDILGDDLAYDQHVIVCLEAGLQSQVESFLIRYDIPYFRVNEHKTSAAFKLFVDLLKMKLEPNNIHLLKLIENDRIDLSSRLNLIEYLNVFRNDVQACLEPLCHVQHAFERPLLKEIFNERSFIRLEKEAEKELSQIRIKLQNVMDLNIQSYSTFIKSFFEGYVSLFKQLSEDDVQSINTIKSILENGNTYLEELKDPYSILIYLINKQTLSTKQKTGVILTDLKLAFVHGKKKVYFLGCTQDGYPQYATNSGLFDDDYLSRIENYDPKARYDYHMQRLADLRVAFDEVVYSYPLGSYEGKAQKLPYELEHYFEVNKIKAQAWRIAEKYPEPNIIKPTLQPELARQMFFTDHELRGSISSFERYFKCPYQYFLYTGLQLGNKDSYGLSNREMGTLMHYVLDQGVSEYGKQYATLLRGQELKRLEPLFVELINFLPHQKKSIELMRDRAVVLLKLSLEFLDDRERNTEFKPFACEKRFDEVIDCGREYPLHLVGTIDRIDTTEYGFMIIDYKSKTTKLKESDVMEGTQLQLCTYLWMGEKYLGLKTPYGAFYFSLGQNNINLNTANENNRDEIWKKDRRFNGWLTDDPHPVDVDGTHHTNLSKKQDESYTFTGGLYKASAIEQRMSELYTQLIDDLSNGIIVKRNKADSCKYCEYKSFCQFKGPVTKTSKITKETTVLR